MLPEDHFLHNTEYEQGLFVVYNNEVISLFRSPRMVSVLIINKTGYIDYNTERPHNHNGFWPTSGKELRQVSKTQDLNTDDIEHVCKVVDKYNELILEQFYVHGENYHLNEFYNKLDDGAFC